MKPGRGAARIGKAVVVALAAWGAVSLAWMFFVANVQWRPTWTLDDDYLAGRAFAQAQPSGRRLYCDAFALARYGEKVHFFVVSDGGPGQDQIAFRMGCEDVEDNLGNRVDTLGDRLQ